MRRHICIMALLVLTIATINGWTTANGDRLVASSVFMAAAVVIISRKDGY